MRMVVYFQRFSSPWVTENSMSARVCARAGVCVLDDVVITHFLKTQRGLAAMFFAHSVTRP